MSGVNSISGTRRPGWFRPAPSFDAAALFRLVVATAVNQFRLFVRNAQEWTRALMMPLQALVALAILVHSGRADLAGYALTAALLFTIGDMGFFVGSEIVAGDRSRQVLELLIASPAPYFVLLIARTLLAPAIIAGGAGALLVTLAVARLAPGLRRLGRLQDIRPAPVV